MAGGVTIPLDMLLEDDLLVRELFDVHERRADAARYPGSKRWDEE